MDRIKVGDAVITTCGDYIGVVLCETDYGLRVWWNDGDITNEQEGADMQRLTSESKINLKNT